MNLITKWVSFVFVIHSSHKCCSICSTILEALLAILQFPPNFYDVLQDWWKFLFLLCLYKSTMLMLHQGTAIEIEFPVVSCYEMEDVKLSRTSAQSNSCDNLLIIFISMCFNLMTQRGSGKFMSANIRINFLQITNNEISCLLQIELKYKRSRIEVEMTNVKWKWNLVEFGSLETLRGAELKLIFWQFSATSKDILRGKS